MRADHRSGFFSLSLYPLEQRRGTINLCLAFTTSLTTVLTTLAGLKEEEFQGFIISS